MVWRGGNRFRSLAGDRRAVHPRGCARLLCAAALASAALRPGPRRSRLTWIRRRRSIRCPTLASNGPISTLPTSRWWPRLTRTKATDELPDAPPLSRRRGGRASLLGRDRGARTGRDRGADRIVRRSNPHFERGARTRPTPRKSTADPAPMPSFWPSCCAARAIMTRSSSRASTERRRLLVVVLEAVARRTISVPVGRAAGS